MKKKLPLLGSALGFLLLILDGKTALYGARQGLTLCFQTVIPSLFPFLFFSSLLISGLMGTSSLAGIGRLFGIPEGCASLLIPGFLGGYPAGAQCIGRLYRQGILSGTTAERLLMFCCNAGPAFLFGILPAAFPKKSVLWQIWWIQLLSAAMIAVCTAPGQSAPSPSRFHDTPLSAVEAMTGAIRATASICGWIILFRVLIAFLERWVMWALPMELRVLCIGLLELANGCSMLGRISNDRLRVFICCVLLSSGGCCVAMQTASVINGLSLKSYLKGKALQSILCILLTSVYFRFGWMALLLISVSLPGFSYIFRSNQNRAGIPQRNPV